MGLTINYGLKLRSKSAERAAALLEQLRQKAMDLPLERVDDELTYLAPEMSAKGLEHYRGPQGLDHESSANRRIFWMLLTCCHYGPNLPWAKKRELTLSVDPIEAYGFQVWPGHGCETAMFGLARYPAEVEVTYRPTDDDRFLSVRTVEGREWDKQFDFNREKWEREQETPPGPDDHQKASKRLVPTRIGGGWRFRSFCKTQYASDPRCGGISNFLRCHLSVIRILEYAQGLGIETDVNDEGYFGPARYAVDYEEARAAGRKPTYADHPASYDINKLIEQCGVYNRMVAGMFGSMKDAMGASGIGLVSPIAQFPNFEHLEADFRAEHGDKFDTLLKTLGEMAKKAAAEAEAKKEQEE